MAASEEKKKSEAQEAKKAAKIPSDESKIAKDKVDAAAEKLDSKIEEGEKADSKEEEKSKEKKSDEEKEENKEGKKDEEKIDEEKKDEEKKDEDSKADKADEKTTTETIMEIGGKKVKKTTGGAKKVPPSSVYKSSDRDNQRQERKKHAVGMRRRTILICNITVEDVLNEKVKNVVETCYHCQIRFLQTKVGKRGIIECRFNSLEDAVKAEGELKEIVIEDRTIGVRNLEDSNAPATWYEVGKELDKYMKASETGKDEDKDGEKEGAEKQKNGLEEELAVCDETKTLVLLNLPLTTTEEMLQAIFSEAQKIRMPLDNTGQCKGHAFLEFETAEITTECQTKYEGISIEDDKDDRQIFIQPLKEYKEKSKARAERARRRSTSRRRTSNIYNRNRARALGDRRMQMSRVKRGVFPMRNSGVRMNRTWGQSDDRKNTYGGRRDGGMNFNSNMNWGQNMMWNKEMLSNMPNLLNMMGNMNPSMMGMNPFMSNTMNFQSQRSNTNRNLDNDYNRNRKRQLNDDQDFYRGDNRRGGGSGGTNTGNNWKTRRFDNNQGNYGTSGSSFGGSYADRDRGNRVPNRDRNTDNRGFRRYNY